MTLMDTQICKEDVLERIRQDTVNIYMFVYVNKGLEKKFVGD